MHDDGEEEVTKKEHSDAHVKGSEDEMKGQPSKKRSRSPEGGGVAGSRDVKRHKNAYEISERLSSRVEGAR
jgi:hypothetical protein